MTARSSLLRALTWLQSMHPDLTLHQIIVLLHVAEREGRTVSDLTKATGFTQSTTSRSLRASGPPGSGWAIAPARGLLQACLAEWDGRSHQIFLSDQGRVLAQRLDEIASEAQLLREDSIPVHAPC